MTVWVVSPGWLVVAEGCCVRIGSHDDELTGRGGVMWRGLAVLCEDWLTWWRCGRFGATVWLGHLCRGGSLAALTSTGQPSPAACNGRDEGVR